MNNLFNPIPTIGARDSSSSASISNPIVSFINVIQGFKSKIENLHWATTSGMPEHEEFDKLYGIVKDFGDKAMEISMGMYGQIRPDVIHPTECDCTDSLSLVDSILAVTISYYQDNIMDGISNAGLRSLFDQFIGDLQQERFRFKLCKD